MVLYELVGRGRARELSGSNFEVSDAVSSFRTAIELDPTCAAAHAGLAVARCLQGSLRAAPHEEALAEAKASALRALAMDSESADAQMALGLVLVAQWDWAAAERGLRRAREIDPSHTEALLASGSLMEALGRPEEGLRFKEQAVARSPEAWLVFAEIANSYWNQRQYDDAIRWAKRVLEVHPGNGAATVQTARVQRGRSAAQLSHLDAKGSCVLNCVDDEEVVARHQVADLRDRRTVALEPNDCTRKSPAFVMGVILHPATGTLAGSLTPTSSARFARFGAATIGWRLVPRR